MQDAGSAVRKYHLSLVQQSKENEKRRKATRKMAIAMRYAWITGHEVLYKFKGMTGDPHEHAIDMLTNSRIYFSKPDQFNDPLDCAPSCRLIRDPPDQALMDELRAEEQEMFAKSGGAPEEELDLLRTAEGVPIGDFPVAVTKSIREGVRASISVFCLSARQKHPLLWSHYADSHKGVCLHFRCRPGTLFGLARGVGYEKKRRPILLPLKYNRITDDVVNAMVWRKADFWGYEEEYRIVADDAAEWGYSLSGRYCAFQPDDLCGLTLGLRITEPDRNALVKLARDHEPPIPVFQADEDLHEYQLTTARIA